MSVVFPQRSICRYCEVAIERTRADEPWGRGKIGGLAGVDTECPQAPNPTDGPMPGHEPGVIATPASLAPSGVNQFPPVVLPYIPRQVWP